MARQSHRPPGSSDPHEQVPPPTMHTGKDPQRQHRPGEFEFEWDASRREASHPERPAQAPAPASTGQSTKRRRIALACNVCRARKSKCDGARPQCSLCSELGFECQYLQSASYSNVIIGKEYLSLIEDRLKEVETRVNSLENNAVPPALAAPRVPLPLPSNANLKTEPTTEPTEATRLADSSLEGTETVGDLIDGMGTVTIAPDEDSASFGPSSNIAFLGKICRAVARLSHDPHPWKPSLTRRNSVGYAGNFSNTSDLTSPLPIVPTTAPDNINMYTVPSEAVSRELLARYFSNAGLLFPYVHERTFMATFDRACKDGFKKVKRTWLGLLNIIYAHAVVHEGDPSVVSANDISSTAKFAQQSEIYYRRASELCGQQIANGTGVDVEVVQYLLLQVQYLQSSQRSAQTWATHGLAVRAAFQLGLYSSDLAKAFPPLEQEIWKKTWFGCVILDRTLSMTFGRPPVIPDSYVKLELPVPYIIVDPPRTLTERDRREPLSVGFYNGTITLYKILHTVIELLYGNNIACSTSPNSADTIARVYQIEGQLSDWQIGLPHDLKLISLADLDFDRLPPEDDAVAEQWRRIRLRFVLTLRYANVRILLHRTVLVKFLEGPDDSEDSRDTTLLHGVGTNSIQIAMRSAKEIIRLVHLVVQSPVTSKKRGLLGAWWFSLYYTFNAALVLVGCILVSLDQNTADVLSTQDLIQHLRMSVEALWDLDRDNRMVARCRDYLDQLVQVVYALAAGRGQIPEPDESRTRGLVHSSLRPTNNDGYPVYPPGAMGGVSHGAFQKQSPLGMEMGEFMLDSDLDFLSGQLFDYNPGMGGM